MENSQRQHRGDHQQRRYRPNTSTMSISASRSSNFPAITDHTSAHLGGSEFLSNMYSIARPEIGSNIPMESSMLMAGSWEPSLPGLHPDRQIMAQDRAYVTSPYDYYSAPYQQPGILTFDHNYPTHNSFLNPDVTAHESALLEDNTGQSLLRRRTPIRSREYHPLSHVQTSYGSRFSPTIRIQSQTLATRSVSVNHPGESTSLGHHLPPVTRPKRNHVQPSRKPSAEEIGNHDKPYAYLLYQALRSAKEHRMSLQEIYRWFEENTNKANDPQSKGWQSSIRHNLSMNEAFILHNEYPAQGKSRNSYWTLTEEALKNGVQSTTRYRNTVSKRPLTFDDMTRQLSEAGRRRQSALGQHASKSRRISHYPEVGPNEQYRSSDEYDIQQQLGQRQSVNDTPGHNLSYHDPSMFITQSLNPSIIITSTAASSGPQYGFVEIHGPSGQFDYEFTQFDT